MDAKAASASVSTSVSSLPTDPADPAKPAREVEDALEAELLEMDALQRLARVGSELLSLGDMGESTAKSGERVVKRHLYRPLYVQASDNLVVCRVCASTIRLADGSIENFVSHLAHKHFFLLSKEDQGVNKWKSCRDSFIKSLSASRQAEGGGDEVPAKRPRTIDKYLQKDSHDLASSLAEYVGGSLLPWSHADHPALAQLLSRIGCKSQVPSRKTVQSRWSGVYDKFDAERKRELEAQLTPGDHGLIAGTAVMFDEWTSKNSLPYGVVCLQYLTPDFKMRTVDRMFSLPYPHTGEKIAAVLRKVLAQSNFFLSTRSTSALVTDGARNNISSLRKVERQKWLHCAAHVLDLLIEDSFDGTTGSPLKKMWDANREMNTVFTASSKRAQLLKEALESANMVPKKPVKNVETRFASVLLVMSRLQYLRPVINSMTFSTLGMPAAEWRETLKEFKCYADLTTWTLELFGPVQHWIETLSGALYPTFPLLARASCAILSNAVRLQRALNDADEFVETKRQVLQEFQTNFMSRRIHSWHALSFMTLARFLCSWTFMELMTPDASRMASIRKTIVEEAETLHRRLARAAAMQGTVSAAEHTGRLVDAWADVAPTTSSAALRAEIVRYGKEMTSKLDLEEGQKPSAEFNDPLTWWASNGHRFHLLSQLARHLLAIPATSTSAERVFSRAGLIISAVRNRLHPTRAIQQIEFSLKFGRQGCLDPLGKHVRANTYIAYTVSRTGVVSEEPAQIEVTEKDEDELEELQEAMVVSTIKVNPADVPVEDEDEVILVRQPDAGDETDTEL